MTVASAEQKSATVAYLPTFEYSRPNRKVSRDNEVLFRVPIQPVNNQELVELRLTFSTLIDSDQRREPLALRTGAAHIRVEAHFLWYRQLSAMLGLRGGAFMIPF